MYYVYLLQLSNNRLYVGKSSDLRKRVEYHQHGRVPSTRQYRPVTLIYYEAYKNKTDAGARELYLKTGDGRQSLQKQLKHTLQGPIV